MHQLPCGGSTCPASSGVKVRCRKCHRPSYPGPFARRGAGAGTAEDVLHADALEGLDAEMSPTPAGGPAGGRGRSGDPDLLFQRRRQRVLDAPWSNPPSIYPMNGHVDRWPPFALILLPGSTWPCTQMFTTASSAPARRGGGRGATDHHPARVPDARLARRSWGVGRRCARSISGCPPRRCGASVFAMPYMLAGRCG